MICGKAYFFLHEFEGLLHSSSELWQTIGLLSLSDDEHKLLRDLAASIATKAMAEFQHRVVDVVTGDPWFALKLVKERDVSVPCPERRRIARDIMDTDDSGLTVNLQKWKRRHKQQLTQAATHGTMDFQSPLATTLLRLRQHAVANTTNVEGFNSIIKCWGQRCPHMRLELLAARVGTKIYLQRASEAMIGRTHMHRLCAAATLMFKTLLDFNTSESMLGMNTSSRWQIESADIPAAASDAIIMASTVRHYPAPFANAILPHTTWARSFHQDFSKAHTTKETSTIAIESDN